MDILEYSWNRMKGYYLWTQSIADERVKDWPLMSSPFPTLALVLCYLVIVKIGPRLMEDRKPLELRMWLALYNLGALLLNLRIGVVLAISSYKLGYSWFCQPVIYSYGYYEMQIASSLWWYYISKLVEFADTFFFILRKKNNQLTFLHVYHHSTMFALWWIGIKYVAGGSSFLAAMVNSFVHVVMYAYYGLASLGPRFQKYLKWKKCLTCVQLVQFTCAGLMGLRALVFGCDFPLWMQYALVVYMISFILLFGRFYWKAYMLRKPAGGAKANANGSLRKTD